MTKGCCIGCIHIAVFADSREVGRRRGWEVGHLNNNRNMGVIKMINKTLNWNEINSTRCFPPHRWNAEIKIKQKYIFKFPQHWLFQKIFRFSEDQFCIKLFDFVVSQENSMIDSLDWCGFLIWMNWNLGSAWRKSSIESPALLSLAFKSCFIAKSRFLLFGLLTVAALTDSTVTYRISLSMNGESSPGSGKHASIISTFASCFRAGIKFLSILIEYLSDQLCNTHRNIETSADNCCSLKISWVMNWSRFASAGGTSEDMTTSERSWTMQRISGKRSAIAMLRLPLDPPTSISNPVPIAVQL